jgi:hypothetical protein
MVLYRFNAKIGGFDRSVDPWLAQQFVLCKHPFDRQIFALFKDAGEEYDIFESEANTLTLRWHLLIS